MTRDEAAAELNGNEYASEGSKDLWARMKESGLVAVFGASDDLMEIRGAVDDELGAYGGGTAYFTKSGMIENKCPDDECPYYLAALSVGSSVDALWDHEHPYSWTIDSEIPHSKFVIKEDGEPYCQGIVFALADVPA